MVLIESKSNPKATHEFTASLIPYGNNTQEIKITARYQPVVNTLTTRQICDIIFVNNNEYEQDISSSMVLIKKKSRSIDEKIKSMTYISSYSSIKKNGNKNKMIQENRDDMNGRKKHEKNK
jgi:hypothetical protein